MLLLSSEQFLNQGIYTVCNTKLHAVIIPTFSAFGTNCFLKEMMIRILYQTRNYWMTMTTYSGSANVPESTYVLKAKTFCPHSDPMIRRGFWPIRTLLNYFCRFMFRVNTGSGFPFKLWGPSPFLQCQRFLNKVCIWSVTFAYLTQLQHSEACTIIRVK